MSPHICVRCGGGGITVTVYLTRYTGRCTVAATPARLACELRLCAISAHNPTLLSQIADTDIVYSTLLRFCIHCDFSYSTIACSVQLVYSTELCEAARSDADAGAEFREY